MAYADDTKQLFLDALTRTGIIADACAEAGVVRPTVKNWRNADPDFSAAYDEAVENAGDALESAARHRAIEGVKRTRYDKEGNLVSEEIVYSDALLALLLKANKPDKFADRSKTELTSPDGSMSPKSDAGDAVRLAAIFEEARKRKEAAENDPLFD